MKILFLGGDARQVYACDYFKSKGYDAEVHLDFNIDEKMSTNLLSSDIIVLPLPISNDDLHLQGTEIEIKEIISLISADTIVYGGKIDTEILSLAQDKNITVIDYYNFEDLVINNALITAEGALFYAKKRYIGSIHGAKMAVIGFGRIGKLLAFLLNSYGAILTVYARKASDLAWCDIIGFAAKEISILSNIAEQYQFEHYDIIFNTVPCQAIGEEYIEKMLANTLIIDLASAPYGIDENIAKKHRLHYYRELSIPGRYAPKSAGEVIAKNIISDINKRGIIL